MFLLDLSPLEIVAWVTGFLAALTVHEAAHAAVANYMGDPTARYAGRITLNPLKHLDPVGTLLLLIIGFGWGKPVPVNSLNFSNPRAGQILTALAGPLANFALALLLALPINFLLDPGSMAFHFVRVMLLINVILMVFNLLPVYPLDGGNIVAPLLPPRAQVVFFQYGPAVLFGVIALDYVFKTGILWSILGPLITIVDAVVNLSTTFSG